MGEEIISRMRLSHTYLNSTLNLIGIYPTDKCQFYNALESVEHVNILS